MKVHRIFRPTTVVVGVLCLHSMAADCRGQDLTPYQRQVVLETRLGKLVIEVFPEAAPRHVEVFLERIRSDFYVGTTFHRAVPMGIIQGGDPLSRDPSAAARYGTGGLNELPWEESPLSHVRGTLSAVLAPGNRDSAGSQFFLCVTDQALLDGQYTAYGRLVEGFEVLEAISNLGHPQTAEIRERVEILTTSLRDRPPPRVIPFTDTSVNELAQYRARVSTDLGDFEISFYPQEAPNHVRQFLRFAEIGLYDGTEIHRIVPGFIIQGGDIRARKPPISQEDARLLEPLQPEFNAHEHVLGTVSMARGEQPDTAIDSFFISLGRHPGLDGHYTVFGYVSRGLEVIEALGTLPVLGEKPIKPVPVQIEVLAAN